jgi:hypothetical protein
MDKGRILQHAVSNEVRRTFLRKSLNRYQIVATTVKVGASTRTIYQTDSPCVEVRMNFQ